MCIKKSCSRVMPDAQRGVQAGEGCTLGVQGSL